VCFPRTEVSIVSQIVLRHARRAASGHSREVQTSMERGNAMSYEKDIPDFALMPAKEPEERVLEPITQGAVYTPVQVTNITEKPKTTITIEEDILVPDTKPDLKEILMIDGKIHLTNREIDSISKSEDYINVSGDIDLQTLYIPEKEEI